MFESIAVRAGDDPAVVYGNRVTTYAELNTRANRLARVLVERGVAPDTAVAVSMPKSDELIVVLLAVLKAGGAYLPLDPQYPAKRLAHMVQDTRPLFLIRSETVVPDLGVPVAELVVDAPETVRDIARHAGHDLTDTCRRAPLLPEHLMYVIYTSGSTGTPKGVAVTHTGVADIVAAQAATIAPRPGDRVLQWASISFDAAFWDWSAALLSGATLVMAPSDELLPGPPLHETLHRHAITHAVLPPVALSATDQEGVLVGGTVMSTGDACTRALVEKWSPGRRMYNGYGPTETTVGSTIAGPVTTSDEITIGTPWQGNTVQIRDERLRLVDDGADGELYLAGNGLARGYLNMPGLTATRFVPDPSGPPGARMYRSGDRGHRRDDGQLVFSGRGDGQVKIRGFRVELGEVEACLTAHPAVDVAAAVVVGDLESARLTAFVSILDGAQISGAELRAHAAQTLPDHMVPSSVHLLTELPVTANGKIDREALRKLARSAARPDERPETGEAGATTLVERTLCYLVKDILSVPEAKPSDNFFDLGGHSVLATRLAGRLRDELGVVVPMRAMFETSTLSELASVVRASMSSVR
ncbi:non-ribosomal peptide synthetase [Lentzea sp. DG1S-22]|uniref:non-ribosomal peptide synthetase n=1 Tax=Lentzea sp. DG1S-22 TaxID=3108822 RepID=UPI002E777184|nr:non-ribosomal peptide synthetase [Lentzea sp. DG1S-22]WVH82775.1 non-ribosomal peptide synthetase [Lentzea sp. DG1S-22]